MAASPLPNQTCGSTSDAAWWRLRSGFGRQGADDRDRYRDRTSMLDSLLGGALSSIGCIDRALA
jgi:hypothetical protein